jgi:hypothetical protein
MSGRSKMNKSLPELSPNGMCIQKEKKLHHETIQKSFDAFPS